MVAMITFCPVDQVPRGHVRSSQSQWVRPGADARDDLFGAAFAPWILSEPSPPARGFFRSFASATSWIGWHSGRRGGSHHDLRQVIFLIARLNLVSTCLASLPLGGAAMVQKSATTVPADLKRPELPAAMAKVACRSRRSLP